MGNENGVSNLQRSFWVVLGYMLLGPFFAGVAVSVLMLVLPAFQVGALLPSSLPPIGVAAVSTFVWAAIPSAVSALIAVWFVYRDGGFGWIIAAVAGVVGFAVAILVTDVPFREYFPVLATIAGLLSMVVREALLSGNIIE